MTDPDATDDAADGVADTVESLIDRVQDGAESLVEQAGDADRPNADQADGERAEVERADGERADAERANAERADGEVGDALDDVQAFVDDVVDVGREAEEFLSTVDVEDVPGAVDLGALDEVVAPGDVPGAVADGEPSRGFDLLALRKLVELGELWREVDVREAWRNAEELEDEVDDVLSLRAFDEQAQEQEDDQEIVDVDADREEGDATDHGLSGEAPSEALATKLGSAVRDAAEAFREGLLAAREELAAVRAENEGRTASPGQPTSRNPSAFSTMALVSRNRPGGPGGTAAPRHSTVPRETRYSRTPNFGRIYGDGFEEATDDE